MKECSITEEIAKSQDSSIPMHTHTIINPHSVNAPMIGILVKIPNYKPFSIDALLESRVGASFVKAKLFLENIYIETHEQRTVTYGNGQQSKVKYFVRILINMDNVILPVKLFLHSFKMGHNILIKDMM